MHQTTSDEFVVSSPRSSADGSLNTTMQNSHCSTPVAHPALRNHSDSKRKTERGARFGGPTKLKPVLKSFDHNGTRLTFSGNVHLQENPI
jgi:hypothetical protein